jgi:hypothetical protein
VAGRVRYIEKSTDFIGNRTRDLPAYSMVPRPTTLCVPEKVEWGKKTTVKKKRLNESKEE